MNKETLEYQWELIGRDKESGKLQVKYPCPSEAVDKIIKEIFESMHGKVSEPNDAIRIKLKYLIDKNIITIEVVQKLTKIPITWLYRLLDEEQVEPISTKKMIALSELIQNLSE